MEERTYGEGFGSGFSRFQDRSGSGDFCDVTVTTSSGDWRLHSLLLASRSEFFYRALAGEFTESRSKVIELHLEKSEAVWPLLVDYFYKDSITVNEGNALALLSLSRQLLVSSVDAYCLEFIGQHLHTSNCIRYLRKAVKHNISDIQQQCVALAAQGFHFLYDHDVSGLPAAVVLEILRHPELLVHCEQQVLRFVMSYLSSTEVEPHDAAAIWGEVRFLYLDNKLFSSLSHHPQLPSQLLLAGAMGRLASMDEPAAAAAGLQPPPRPTYCCDGRYGLPGGSRTLTLALEDIWTHVAPLCSVRVSGVSEGQPEHVLSADPDAWFETDESSEPMPWVQVVLPANVRVVRLTKYVFSHGHRRSGYFRMRNWQTLTAADAAGPFSKLMARPSANEAFEVMVAKPGQDTPWRSIKLVGTDRQEDSVFRLCLRNLRLFGCCEVDLLQQGQPQALVLTHELVHKIHAAKATAAGGAPADAAAAGSTAGSRRASGNGWGPPGVMGAVVDGEGGAALP
ncbi:hypothetical protein OEZ86_009773 [Tetradesmus obliquus]|uniref:BTB domain-containing protein n=1 Tax=Tetradesmus obliquus TaxID=3088 RepID=A0ABY8UQ83_TETOB|nr:hypothetical protein OEZ85_001215 [Tetradesmus obliquus]WIA43271.1 hypothetical protein OEZ86_009773 [Tetradesmus obliquus]